MNRTAKVCKLFLDGQDDSYILERKNVKNINLRVKSDGSVMVSAHWDVSEQCIDDFVRSQIPFIEKARRQLAQSKEHVLEQLQFRTGERIPFLGSFLVLQTEQAERRFIPDLIAKSQAGLITYFSRNQQGEAIFCQDGKLYFYTLETEDSEYNRQLYESWQKIQVGILCDQISRNYYPVFQKLGIPYPTIKIRKMSSRWGSCIPRKQKVTFNSQLLEKPIESIEYVVVHEFSHFIHPNHSKNFYDFVGQILPDWKWRKQLLT